MHLLQMNQPTLFAVNFALFPNYTLFKSFSCNLRCKRTAAFFRLQVFPFTQDQFKFFPSSDFWGIIMVYHSKVLVFSLLHSHNAIDSRYAYANKTYICAFMTASFHVLKHIVQTHNSFYICIEEYAMIYGVGIWIEEEYV